MLKVDWETASILHLVDELLAQIMCTDLLLIYNHNIASLDRLNRYNFVLTMSILYI